MAVLWSLAGAAVKFLLCQDNDLSYSIPHKVKCHTEEVNHLSRSLETCKMLKIILPKLNFMKISESVIPHQTLFKLNFAVFNI